MNVVGGISGLIIGLLAMATVVGWIRRSPWPGTAAGAALGVLVLLSTPAWLVSGRWCVATGPGAKTWIVAACLTAAATPLLAGSAWDRARYDGESLTLAAATAAGHVLAGVAFVAVAFRFGLPDHSVCPS